MKPLVFILVVVLSGCSAAGSSTGMIKNQLQRQLPDVQFERESHIALGGLLLWAAKRIVSLVDEADEEAGVYLRSVDRVVVDTYRVNGWDNDVSRISMPDVLQDKIQNDGWHLAVKSQEDGESNWVLLDQSGPERIDGIYVVSLDQHELNIVYVKGEIDTIVAQALADEPGLLADGF